MDEHGLPGAGERPTVVRIEAGSQNLLFEVRRGGTHMALRRPPDPIPARREEAFVREHRLLAALSGSDVPHARLLGGCDDPEVLGAPFVLMEFVDGWTLGRSGWPSPYDNDIAARAGTAFELVEGIAKLARLDWQVRGLEGFGRPDGFHDRQVDRWLSHLSSFQFRELPGIDVAAEWLRRHRPRRYEPGIMHGDYQFANAMFAPGAPARLEAIVDWEMATIGDPLLDLGWALMSWPPEGDDMVEFRYFDFAGMPARDALLERYESVSGRPTDDIDYYVILARFKLAVVLEGGAARRAKGEADERTATYESLSVELARKAADLTRTTSLRPAVGR
jgi:aminoglycoside phosphotransferase (APT) family kinase protein